MASLPIAGFAPGRAVGKHVGNTEGAFGGGMLAVILGLAGVEIDLSYGVGHGCELGAILGLRLGGEARCAITDERDGAKLSVAPFVRGGFQAALARGPWLAAGIDLSRGREPGVALSPTISYGTESHHVSLREDEDHRDFHNVPFLLIDRTEWRLNLPVGVVATFSTSSAEASGGRVMFGMTPYWTFRHGPPHCEACNDEVVTLTDEDEQHERSRWNLLKRPPRVGATERETAATYIQDWGVVLQVGGGGAP